MNEAALEILRKMLVIQEGLETKLYYDTLGIPTIAVGRNLRDVGLSYDECMYLLDNDIRERLEQLPIRYTYFTNLSDVRKMVVISMSFMGMKTFSEFHKFHGALMLNDYKTAAQEMLNSRWARQVKRRSQVLATMMETNEFPEDFH